MEKCQARCSSAPAMKFSEDSRECHLEIQTALYPADVVLKTVHRFTGKCYVLLTETGHGMIQAQMQKKGDVDLVEVVGQFCNELLDGSLRTLVADESEAERNLILAHALSRHPLFHRELEDAPAFSDPLGLKNPD